MSEQRLPVLIVGAGPTGLTVAALLADHGICSVILERWESIYPQPRAVHLDDEVYRIIARLGLADEFAAISRPAKGLRLVTGTLSTIAEFPRDSGIGVHGFPAASMFDQPELERLLRTAVGRRSGLITLRSGVEVDSIDHSADSVAVRGTDRHTGRPVLVEGSYLLGCDGAGSVTRSAVGSRWHDLGFSQRWLVIDIDTTTDLRQWEGVQQICDSRRAGTFMRVGDSRYRWEFQLHEDESTDDYAEVDALRPLLRPWVARIDDIEFSLIRCAEYTFDARVAERWRDRRVFLLGDAAHLTPPFIGQGMGAGIRDAANLSWKIAAVVAGAVPPSSLDSYERERKPHVVSLIRLAMCAGAVMTGGGRGGDAVRAVAAPLLARVPELVSRLTDSTTPPLRSSYYVRDGVIARRMPRPLRRMVSADTALTGTLAPNAVTGPNGRRLDDRAPGFVLVSVDYFTDELRFEVTRRGALTMTVEPAGVLGQWMLAHRARSVIVRPDGTVMAAGRSIAAIYTLLPTVSTP